MGMLIATLYNVLIYNIENDTKIRKQFYSGSIGGAVEQGEEFGKVVKVTEALWDNESHLY